MALTTELPDWAKDAVYVTTEFHFSWKDRFKILFGWNPLYDCGVATQELPGRTLAFSDRMSFKRPSWWPWKPKLLGYEEKR